MEEDNIDVDEAENERIAQEIAAEEEKGIPEQKEARKTFITDKHEGAEYRIPFTLHDLLIPGGKPAKLAKIPNATSPDLRVSEILFRLKFRDPTPVILLMGSYGTRASKVLAGVCRAAFHTDAVIVDSAISSGIEKFCIRKGVKLIGVAPEGEILYPKVNPTERFDNELSNGHSHIVLLGDKAKGYHWGDEARIKIDIADTIATGKHGTKPKCKVVGVLLGDNDRCINELALCNDKGWPVVVIEGSDMCNGIIQYKETKDPSLFKSKRIPGIVDKGHFYGVNANSEDVAQLVHLALCITL